MSRLAELPTGNVGARTPGRGRGKLRTCGRRKKGYTICTMTQTVVLSPALLVAVTQSRQVAPTDGLPKVI